MADALVPAPPRLLAARIEQLQAEAQEIIAAGVPRNTRRTYTTQWRGFIAWCGQNDRCALPTTAETLILYLTDRSAVVGVSTLNVALAAITVAHREAGQSDWAATDLPGVRVFMRGLRRTKGKGPKKKQALALGDLARGLPVGDSPKAIRDRALLLTGFFAALRRSELVGLDIEDVEAIPTGLRLAIWHSKTDKGDRGHVVAIPRLDDHPEVCPVRALTRLLTHLEPGPVFTSMRGGGRLLAGEVAEIVKEAAERAGFEPHRFAGHSLRAGFATDAARARAEERDIMLVTRHRSERTLRGYIQEATLGENHPGLKIAMGITLPDDKPPG
jgi:integrase